MELQWNRNAIKNTFGTDFIILTPLGKSRAKVLEPSCLRGLCAGEVRWPCTSASWYGILGQIVSMIVVTLVRSLLLRFPRRELDP